MKWFISKRLIVGLVIIGLLMTSSACGLNDIPYNGQTQKPSNVSLEYQPPFVPVTFVVDESGVTIAGGVSMVTPVGRFGIGLDYPVAEFGQVTLVLQNRTTGENQVYFVSVEDEVQILVQGTTQINIGRNGVITVDITEGQLESIVFTNESPPEPEMGMLSAQSAGPPPITVNMDEQGEVELAQ